MRESVRWFAEQMEAALAEHDDRPGWKGEPTDWLFDRLLDEADELQRALTVSDQVVNEAVDVANFAMMIADNCRAALDTAQGRMEREGITEQDIYETRHTAQDER